MSRSSNKEAEPPGNTYIQRDLLQGFGSAQLWGLVKQYVKAVAFVLGAVKPEVGRAGGHGHEEGKRGQDGTAGESAKVGQNLLGRLTRSETPPLTMRVFYR